MTGLTVYAVDHYCLSYGLYTWPIVIGTYKSCWLIDGEIGNLGVTDADESRLRTDSTLRRCDVQEIFVGTEVSCE